MTDLLDVDVTLVAIWTGSKPTKRTYEMLCFYWMGWVAEAELAEHIGALNPRVE